MPLDTLRGATRRLDLATFTGDTWALNATLANPPANVPRLVAQGDYPVRWVIVGMSSGADDATQVPDTTTNITARMIKISRTEQPEPLVVPVTSVSGTIVNQELEDAGMGQRDVFVLSIPVVTLAGAAPWLWICVRSGAEMLPAGVAP